MFLKHFPDIVYSVCVHAHMYICYMCGCTQVRELLSGIGSLLPLCVYQERKRVCLCITFFYNFYDFLTVALMQ